MSPPPYPTQTPDNSQLTDASLLEESMCIAAACDAYLSRSGFRASGITMQFLLGRSLELVLKALLIKHGSKESDLRRIGHDLLASYDECSGKSSKLASATVADRAKIAVLSDFYKRKLFEYPLVAGYVVTPPAMLRDILHRIIAVVFSEIWTDERYRHELNLVRAQHNGIAIPDGLHYPTT